MPAARHLQVVPVVSILITCVREKESVMVAQTMLTEYMGEVRRSVCSRCIEKPPGGPPCLPLGKRCGVELHLGEIVDLVHGTDSRSIDPYIEHLHDDVCAFCANRVTKDCPCVLDYLLPLVVEAIETVDARHAPAEA